MIWNISRFASIICLASALTAGAGVAVDAKMLSITDDRGVTLGVPAHPQRIAAIAYLATDVAPGVRPVATTYMMPGRNLGLLLVLAAGDVRALIHRLSREKQVGILIAIHTSTRRSRSAIGSACSIGVPSCSTARPRRWPRAT